MQELEYALKEGSLYYVIQKNSVEITRFAGIAGTVEIPSCIQELPVRSIAKKAFLSKKSLRKVTLPDTIEEVGDWAFAYCDKLVSVSFGNRDTRFARAVFLDCFSLEEVLFPDVKPQLGGLLAAAVTGMESYYLLDGREMDTSQWLEKWDAKMISILHTPDSEGYSKQVLCGEEDYGSTDLEAYLSGRRCHKVRLALRRLLYPVGEDNEVCRRLKDYLVAHTKGCESEETWQVILKECADKRAYYELFAKIGCFHKENAVDIIGDIGEDYPEMKAFFMKYRADSFGNDDFLGALEL